MKSLSPIHFSAITKEQIRLYCEASGDWNRIHTDDDFAKEAGLPGVIAHGMLSMGLAGRALLEWGYSLKKIKSFESKFKDIVTPGDSLTAEGWLENQTEISMVLKNQSGKEILTATALLYEE